MQGITVEPESLPTNNEPEPLPEDIQPELIPTDMEAEMLPEETESPTMQIMESDQGDNNNSELDQEGEEECPYRFEYLCRYLQY